MNLAIIRKKRFYTFKFFIPITLTSEPKDLESDVFLFKLIASNLVRSSLCR